MTEEIIKVQSEKKQEHLITTSGDYFWWLVRNKWFLWIKIFIPTIFLIAVSVFWGRKIWLTSIPFICALLIAYLLNPVVNLLLQTKVIKKRIFAVFCVYITIFLALFIILAIFLPILTAEIKILISNSHIYVNKVRIILIDKLSYLTTSLSDKLADWEWRDGTLKQIQEQVQSYIATKQENLDWFNVITGTSSYLTQTMQNIAKGIASSAGNIVSYIALFLFTIVISFYMLLDFESLKSRILSLFPPEWREKVTNIAKDLDTELSRFLKGQIIICFILGILSSLILLVLRVKFAVLIGMFAGLCNLVPYLCPTVGITLSSFIVIIDMYPNFKGAFFRMILIIGSLLALQAVDGICITPRIMGKKIRIHPLLVIFAFMLGARIMGILGIILAIPTLCLFRVLWRNLFTKASS